MHRSTRISVQPSFLIIFLLVFAIGVLMGFGVVPFDLRSRAQFVPANIFVDVSSVGRPLDRSFYHAFAQGGEEATNMLSGFEAKIATVRPEIIRLDHIFDYYNVVSREGGVLRFQFDQLDSALSSIRRTGAIPMLSLSYMPPSIAQDGGIVQVPDRWDEWAYVVQKTVEFVSGKYDNVYYEVWNEPDHPQFGGWKYYGSKNYLTLYRYAVQGATQARGVRPFKIGGPSTTALYKAWIEALITQDIRVDFLSWHTYEMEPSEYAKELALVRSWVGSSRELHVTEFGFNSYKDSRYATQFAAAHIAAVVRAVIDDPPTYIYSFELKDGPNETEGKGWGMWTYQGASKPRAGVFPFLDQMTGNRLFLSGEGSRITAMATLDGAVVKILLINFDQHQVSESFPITVQNLIPGTYAVTYRRLFGPLQSVHEEVAEHTWQKHVYMPANGVMIIELARI